MSYEIFGDWGTSRLRLFRIEGGRVTDRRDGPGIGALAGHAEQALCDGISGWRSEGPPRAIRLCGMIGSRNGWIEVPYLDCPVNRAEWRAKAAALEFDGSPVLIMAGLACNVRRGSPDVMRGEETQIFGAMEMDPALATGIHIIALPGTHSKWAMVDGGRIVAFHTFFTGELFALLRDQSTLTRLGKGDDEPDATEGFDDGLARAADGQLLGALFEARSAQLRLARSRSWATNFLSGLLIGREVIEATEGQALRRVTLVGDPELTALYARALDRCGIVTSHHGGEACALAGLSGAGAAR